MAIKTPADCIMKKWPRTLSQVFQWHSQKWTSLRRISRGCMKNSHLPWFWRLAHVLCKYFMYFIENQYFWFKHPIAMVHSNLLQQSRWNSMYVNLTFFSLFSNHKINIILDTLTLHTYRNQSIRLKGMLIVIAPTLPLYVYWTKALHQIKWECPFANRYIDISITNWNIDSRYVHAR